MQGDSDRDLRTGFFIFIIVVFLLDKKSGEFLFYVGSFLTGYSCVKLRYLYGYKERRGEFMMFRNLCFGTGNNQCIVLS